MPKIFKSVEDVIASIADSTPRPGKLSPMLKVDDNTLHIALYIGMGNVETRPISDFDEVVQKAITQSYQFGSLIADNNPFTYYSGSPIYTKLKYIP